MPQRNITVSDKQTQVIFAESQKESPIKPNNKNKMPEPPNIPIQK
jgi:hypothetical protein